MKLFARKHYLPWFERKSERSKTPIDMVLPAEVNKILPPPRSTEKGATPKPSKKTWISGRVKMPRPSTWSVKVDGAELVPGHRWLFVGNERLNGVYTVTSTGSAK